MRKLATIQKIISSIKHPNADSLSIVEVLGWRLITKLNEFQVGELCVFCEIDSVLPDKPEVWPEFQFMKPRNMRVKTIKLRGEVSQGLCFPISILKQGAEKLVEGDEVTEILEITKYDPDAMRGQQGTTRHYTFPSFIVKTDEERVQNVPRIFELFKDVTCYMTEKVDGSSFTMYRNGGKVGLCSRNYEIEQSEANNDNPFYKAAIKYDLFNKMGPAFEGFAIQAELIGPKIQGNRYDRDGFELYLFSVQKLDGQTFENWAHIEKVAQDLGIKTAPYLGDMKLGNHNVKSIVELSKGQSALANILREGIVIRSQEYIKYPMRGLNHLSFKVINPDFLLKYET